MKIRITLLSLTAVLLLMAFPHLLPAQAETKIMKKVVVISGDSVVTTIHQDGVIDTSMVFHIDIDAEDMDEAMQKISESLGEIGDDLERSLEESGLNNISVETQSNGSTVIIRHSAEGDKEIVELNIDSLRESIEMRIHGLKSSTLEKLSGDSPNHKIKVVHTGLPFIVVKAENTAKKEISINIVDQNDEIVLRKSIFSKKSIVAEQVDLNELESGTYFVVIKADKETVRYKLHIK